MLVKDIDMLYKHYINKQYFIVRRIIGTILHNLKNEFNEYNRTLNILTNIKTNSDLSIELNRLKKKISYKRTQINLAKLIFDDWRYIQALELACIIYNKYYNTNDNPFIKENLPNLIKKHFKFIFINCKDSHIREIPKDIIVLNRFYDKTYNKKYRRKSNERNN
jgi:hypothetical protein